MTLVQFFTDNQKVGLAFSGGVDSSYLLYAGLACGADIRPYFIKTPFQPAFELEDAYRLAAKVGTKITVIELDVLANEPVVINDKNRCYYCKRELFTALRLRALQDGYRLLIDGTNYSDDASDRPGMQALAELGVRSPLRECGITKSEVRKLSKEASLFTWDKPAYACLATRIPTGVKITAESLVKIEKAEDVLFSLDFTDFRVRLINDYARIQLPANQMDTLIKKREEVLARLKGFSGVLLDIYPRGDN